MIEVIKTINPSLKQELDQYLALAKPGACPEHDPRWLDVLSDGLKHRPCLLVAREDPSGQINGYLPLALVASRLFGRFLVSLPYLNRAGIVANDEQTASQLLSRAVELAQEHNAKHLELRHHGQWDQLFDNNQQIHATRDDKVRMVLELPNDEEALWKSIGPKVRNQTRKGDKFELTIRWGTTDLLNDFYDIFAVNMRDLGTPVYAKKLFASIMTHFPNEAEFAVVDFEGRPISTAMIIHQQHSTQVPSASCLREFNHTNANMWMYHHLLLRAITRGSKTFDFGRSSEDSGTYRFKKQWGAQPHPTRWYYHVRSGDISSLRPDSPGNRRRVETWKKMPLWLTRLIGPIIVRGIP